MKTTRRVLLIIGGAIGLTGEVNAQTTAEYVGEYGTAPYGMKTYGGTNGDDGSGGDDDTPNRRLENI